MSASATVSVFLMGTLVLMVSCSSMTRVEPEFVTITRDASLRGQPITRREFESRLPAIRQWRWFSFVGVQHEQYILFDGSAVDVKGMVTDVGKATATDLIVEAQFSAARIKEE